MLKKYFSIVANPIRLHLMLWGLYFTFVWAHQLNHTPRGLTAGSIASWADGALHLSLISYFSYTTLTPDNLPVYYHHPLAYPFLVNWLTALLVRLGLPLITSYTFMGLILSLLFIYLLYRFYFYFQPQPLTALISSTIFLCSGGLGFIWFLQNLIFPPLTTPSTLLESEYTNMAAQHIGWINVVTSEFLPQRAFLLGISFGLLLLIFSYRTLAIKQSLPYKTYFFFGLAYGLLPIIHPHTMIALSPLIITICFSMLKRRQLTQLVIFCLTILSISLPLIHLFVLSGSGISQIRFYPGWLAKSYSVNWLWFWFLNWGIFPLVSLLGLKYLNTFQKIFIFPFTLVFIAANLFLFQAYDWDNSKLLTWVYLVFSAPAGLLITKLFSQPTPRQIIGLILFITTIFSGSLDIIRVTNYSRRSIPMLSTEEINLSNWINQHTPTESIWLTASNHNHPVPVLTGRQIIMGYPGWLWSYGIDYSTTQSRIQSIFQGTPEATYWINYFSIDYVVIGPHETSQFQPNLDFFSSTGRLDYQSPQYSVYYFPTDL